VAALSTWLARRTDGTQPGACDPLGRRGAATVGEISDACCAVFGEYQETATL
jgi:hypothetical protein